MKKFLKFLKYTGYVVLGVAGIFAFTLILVLLGWLAQSMGNFVPIIAGSIFSVVLFVFGTGFFIAFCSNFMAMLFPRKYKPVLVEVVGVDVHEGEYTDDYSPMVRRLDDFSNPPHLVVPKHKSYTQNERDKAYALIGTRMTLYARDNAPYDLYYEENLKKSSTIGWTLAYLAFAILFFLFFWYAFDILIGMLFRGETFDWALFWDSMDD
ncbi:MAG: hypothetical protein ACI4M3_00255 [Acutalibacteraceae bacterium]